MRIASLIIVAFFATAPAVTLAGDEAPKVSKVKHVKKHKAQRWGNKCPAPKTSCKRDEFLCPDTDPKTGCPRPFCVHGKTDWDCPW
jgi:hypothetical protein